MRYLDKTELDSLIEARALIPYMGKTEDMNVDGLFWTIYGHPPMNELIVALDAGQTWLIAAIPSPVHFPVMADRVHGIDYDDLTACEQLSHALFKEYQAKYGAKQQSQQEPACDPAADSFIQFTHQTYERNTQGRDIVVGDIHGEFGLLSDALSAIDFDRTRDRLFGLGDLIDRGPDPMAALSWLREPWFHSTLGNHEAHHLLRTIKDLPRQWRALVIQDDIDSWVNDVPPADYSELLKTIAMLPLAITLQSSQGPVGLLHANLPSSFPTWASFTTAINTGTLSVSDFSLAIWSRRVELNAETKVNHEEVTVSDVAALIHGHTIPYHFLPMRLGNRLFIETGAFLPRISGNGGITLVDIEDLDNPLLNAFQG